MPARLTTVLALLVAAGLAAILLFAQPREAQPVIFSSWYPLSNDQGDPAFADFENHIPCNVEGCDRMKFGIVLYRDASGTPTTYLMSRVFVAVSDDRTVNSGTWSITEGTPSNPEAIVYRLDTGAPDEFDAFWAIGDDILFILDDDLAPRVGDAAFGYSLNRIPLGKTYEVPSAGP